MTDEKYSPRLSDVMGALVSAVARARCMADNEVINISRLYRKHELLSGLSVPRLRVRNISMELPILLQEMTPPKKLVPNSPMLIVRALLSEARNPETRSDWLALLSTEDDLADDLRSILSELIDSCTVENPDASDPSLNTCLRNIHTQLVARLRLLRTQVRMESETLLNSSQATLTDAVGETTEKVLKLVCTKWLAVQFNSRQSTDSSEKWSTDNHSHLTRQLLNSITVKNIFEQLREATERAAVEQGDEPADFIVEVNTDAIKNAGTPQGVTRFRMSISEEGLEWSTEEQKGEDRTWKLIPE